MALVTPMTPAAPYDPGDLHPTALVTPMALMTP